MHIKIKAMKLFSISLFVVLALPSLFAFQAHDQNLAYPHPAIVVSSSVSYISVQDVPAGTTITSTNYWTPLLGTAPSTDPGTPPTTEPSANDSNLSNLTPPEDENDSIVASGHPNASNEAFVKQQYLDFLDREAVDPGLSSWADQLDSNNLTRTQFTAEYVFSDEYQGSVGAVARLYLASFDRLPDKNGFNYWINIRKTNSLKNIADTFASSDEFKSKYGDLSDAEFIDRIYINVLGRTDEQLSDGMDSSGRAFWTNQLTVYSRGDIMLSFSDSGENLIRTNSKIQVIGFYYGMLRRFPEASGFDYWVSVLDAGVKPYDLIDVFIDSSEYKNRF